MSGFLQRINRSEITNALRGNPVLSDLWDIEFLNVPALIGISNADESILKARIKTFTCDRTVTTEALEVMVNGVKNLSYGSRVNPTEFSFDLIDLDDAIVRGFFLKFLYAAYDQNSKLGFLSSDLKFDVKVTRLNPLKEVIEVHKFDGVIVTGVTPPMEFTDERAVLAEINVTCDCDFAHDTVLTTPTR